MRRKGLTSKVLSYFLKFSHSLTQGSAWLLLFRHITHLQRKSFLASSCSNPGMDNDSPSARSSPTPLASPRLPSTPPIPATPIREENDFDEETDGQWSPCQDDIVCISSSSSESLPPWPKKLITDFFNRTSAVQEKSMPSFLCQFNPLTNAQKSLPPCSVTWSGPTASYAIIFFIKFSRQ